MAETLKARRVSGGRSPLIYILLGVIVALLAIVVVFLARSPLFSEPSANELARREVVASLEANPGDPNLLMMLAEVEYELGRERDAYDHAAQAVENAGETATIRMRYAMLLMRGNRLDEATEALQAELEIDPTSGESHFLLGQIQREQGDLESAAASLEEAMRLNPLSGDYRIVYADLLVRAGRTDDAIAAYQSALQVLPGDERAVQGLAELGVTYEATETPNPHGN